MSMEQVIPVARQLLGIEIDDTHRDWWLWEHSERVMHLCEKVAALPEADAGEIDLTALQAAALFHDAGWIIDLQQARYERWQLLTRPTNDIQRELGAGMLAEEIGHLLPTPTVRRAGEIIRKCNDRRTDLVEARILAESEALDEVGATYFIRQYRQYQAEGRPLQQLVDSWDRQREYKYWDVRINDGFRYDTTRRLARERIAAIDAFIGALGVHLRADDLSADASHLSDVPPTPTTT
jgi:hypothetical protein